MKIALDPTPFHHDISLLDIPAAVADCSRLDEGYEEVTSRHADLPTQNGGTINWGFQQPAIARDALHSDIIVTSL